MLEFCQTVDSSLENYEADGVSSPSINLLVHYWTFACAGLADSVGRLRSMEESQGDKQ